MPIYEFQCLKCQHAFEELVFGGSTPLCPQCGGKDAEKIISRPARSGSRRGGGDEDDYSDDFGGGGSSCGCGSCGGGNCASCGN